MIHEKLMRDIFSRFQNVNLLALIYDLEEGLVAKECWVEDDGRMCPAQHGGRNHEDLGNLNSICGLWKLIDLWDDGEIKGDEMLSVCRSIFAERLADAEAGQNVLKDKPKGMECTYIIPDNYMKALVGPDDEDDEDEDDDDLDDLYTDIGGEGRSEALTNG